jgi:hypothetical protein
VVEDLFWIRFEVKQVAVSPRKPHGLDYSLTFVSIATKTQQPCSATSGPMSIAS